MRPKFAPRPPNPSLQYKPHVDQQLKNLRQFKLFERCDMFASQQPFFAHSIGRMPAGQSILSEDLRAGYRGTLDDLPSRVALRWRKLINGSRG